MTVRRTPFPSYPFVSSVDVLARAVRAARTQAQLTMADAALVANVALQTFLGDVALFAKKCTFYLKKCTFYLLLRFLNSL